MLGTEGEPGAGSARTYTWVLEQGTEDSPADGVGVLHTEGGEGHPEKSGGRGRQGADLVTREGAESRLPFLTLPHTHSRRQSTLWRKSQVSVYLGSRWLPNLKAPSGAQAVRSYMHNNIQPGTHPSAPLPLSQAPCRGLRRSHCPWPSVPPVPTRSRKRLLASTEALLMLRAGVRPSRWLQSCRRPPSGIWASCSWLHSNSIWGTTRTLSCLC